MNNKWRTILLLSLAELLAMSLWFSATAVVPALMEYWGVSGGAAAWLTMSVQIGFVTGALLSALLNLPDIFPPRKVMAVGALSGALLNALVPAMDLGFAATVVVRFGTGMSLAAVYPVGMKIMATWTKHDRGLGIGLMVGALTVGSASPYLVRAFGTIDAWQPVLYVVSGMAAAGGVLGWFVGKVGPYAAPAPPFRWRHMGNALRVRSLRLANFGYLGHMWELYAMWTWIALFLAESYRASGIGTPVGGDRVESLASLATFAVIAAGGIGSLVAGHIADRWGRTRTTMTSMAISGACAGAIGLLFGASPALVTAVAIIWGLAIVADSAQFSTSISELADREYMGTHLTTQTAMGFLLTMVTIRLIPAISEVVGWRWTFTVLVIGPAFGIWAMWQLLRSPEAEKLAGGRG